MFVIARGMDPSLNDRIKQAVEFLKQEVRFVPSAVVILSGALAKFTDSLTDTMTIDADKIPYFLKSSTEGHSGKILFGKYKEVPLAVMCGRPHYYEGYSMQEVTFPIHALHVFGAKTLIVTSAGGGINAAFQPGDLMLITDHVNFMGANPLRGVYTQGVKNHFVDMTNAYSKQLQQVAMDVAKHQQIPLQHGVYVAVAGPSYETASEIRAFRQMGADAVGMSTVPEVTVANYHRMQVLGLCCISNFAADLHPGGMHHGEVLKTMQELEPQLVKLLHGVIERIGNAGGSA